MSKQDKISIAITELEKVRNFANSDFRKNCYINSVKLDKFINNQIKKLKGELNEKENSKSFI